jgi:Zn-dependent metalloprotease
MGYDTENPNTEEPTSVILRKEGEPPLTEDIAYHESFNKLYENIGIVYNFFKNLYGRNSLDDRGCTIVAIGNTPSSEGASWNPNLTAIEIPFDSAEIVDSNNKVPVCSTLDKSNALDTISHELTHAVNDYSEEEISDIGFPNNTEIAIREHLADTFGILAVHWHTNNIYWGYGKFCREAFDLSLRSFDETPSYSKGVMTMDDFVYKESNDQYGELIAGYTNSKILSYAFYVFAVFVGGEAYDIPGKVWYQILASSNSKKDFPYSTSFVAFANASLFYCEQLYPEHLDKLRYAWHKVKVLNPFEGDKCKILLVELQYQIANQNYWLNLGIKDFKDFGVS